MLVCTLLSTKLFIKNDMVEFQVLLTAAFRPKIFFKVVRKQVGYLAWKEDNVCLLLLQSSFSTSGVSLVQ